MNIVHDFVGESSGTCRSASVLTGVGSSTQQCLDFEGALAGHLTGPVRVLNDAE